MGKARKLAAAQMPTARGRSCSENRTVSAEMAMTMIPAPASPSRRRATRNAGADDMAAHSAEPAPNRASEMSRTFLRPYRSPSRPAGSMAAASTSA